MKKNNQSYEVIGEDRVIVNVESIDQAAEFAKVPVDKLKLIDIDMPLMFQCCSMSREMVGL